MTDENAPPSLRVLFSMQARHGVAPANSTPVRRLALQETFRHIVHTQLYMANFEKKLAEAMTREDCWLAIREAGRDFGFVQVQMRLGGAFFEESLGTADKPEGCTMGTRCRMLMLYNFTNHSESSVKHFVAMGAFMDVLEHALGSRIQQFPPAPATSGSNDLRQSNGHVSESVANSATAARS